MFLLPAAAGLFRYLDTSQKKEVGDVCFMKTANATVATYLKKWFFLDNVY